VVPWRAKGVLLDEPPWWEDDKVGDSCSGMVRWARENRVDGRIGVVEGDTSNDREPAKIILVGEVYATLLENAIEQREKSQRTAVSMLA
jgi:hypothetical protein